VRLTGPRAVVKPAVHSHRMHGQVAQSVEQGIENPRVGGSIPSLAILMLLVTTAGCGDRCEVLCQQTASAIANCRVGTSLTWQDLGARGRADFADRCRDEWDRRADDLSSNDLREALDVCSETTRDVSRLSCEELIALYAPVE
jgi:hypothetical protein